MFENVDDFLDAMIEEFNKPVRHYPIVRTVIAIVFFALIIAYNL